MMNQEPDFLNDPFFNSDLDYAEQMYINDKLKNPDKGNSLTRFLKGHISIDNKKLLKEIGVIDFHSHIGNILERKPEQIYDKSKDFPIDIRTVGGNFGKFKAPGKIMEIIMHTKIIDNILKQSGKNRNSSATLKTFGESLDESFVSKAVCLPIPPYQTFDDLDDASKYDNRIISFTGVDFSKFYTRNTSYNDVLNELESEFKEDILNGAKGLKIHPIIQGISVDTNMIDDVVNLWTNISKGLPIIFHSGVTEYCRKDEKCSEHRPEFGQIKYFVKLAKKHKDANIVIGHSGLFQVDQVIDSLSSFDNISVDTSFQGEEKIKELLHTFGVERLHFASDWPYGDRIPAVNVMLEILSKVHSGLYSDSRIKELIFRDNALNSMKMN